MVRLHLAIIMCRLLFVNHEMRRKGKESFSSSTITEALTAREIDFNRRKGKGDVDKSKTDDHKLVKHQCAFYKEGH